MTAQHWDGVFRTKDTHQVSWYQDNPETSLALIADTSGSVIDVGAGASTLIDELLALGRTDVTVLDVSEAALDLTRRRLADRAKEVSFVVADITSWQPQRNYQVWHDRAVFHFLTDPADQSTYVNLATQTISPGGVLVLGTFAADGPTHCSGLPTVRYGAADLADMFSVAFDLEDHVRETHRTPAGGRQSFTWVKLRRH
jgi:2-polyprenyl-3-methyl-5-hydroxy-6-metoxy-1,4-benzoquinol methylase